jgi:hypothetical protein
VSYSGAFHAAVVDMWSSNIFCVQDDADIRPVGSGRDDPNRDPELPRHNSSSYNIHRCARVCCVIDINFAGRTV